MDDHHLIIAEKAVPSKIVFSNFSRIELETEWLSEDTHLRLIDSIWDSRQAIPQCIKIKLVHLGEC